MNHPNIVTIFDIGETDGTYYIASELIEGENLRQRYERGEMDLPVALDIAIQVATALAAAHEKGIVHRDIKPENVMIRADGYVKVLDFGIAKLTEGFASSVSEDALTILKVETVEGVAIGTASYMSPEQARGQAVDSRTDIWSCGVMLYEILAGHLPFEGGTAGEVIACILDRAPAPLARYITDPPSELQRIISKALTKNREERYQTIKDMLLDLKALKQDLEFAEKLERSVPPRTEARAHSTIEAAAERSARNSLLKASTTDEQVAVDSISMSPASTTLNILSEIKRHKRGVAGVFLVLLLAATGTGYWILKDRWWSPSSLSTPVDSIAVLPFANESDDSEVEYLSDGITESLINSLSKLPKLSVKARSSVFRYKGKNVEPQQAASELSVQAILNGRVTQRGDDLTLFLSLVDARNGNQIWGEQYHRKLADLVTLQGEIARDVSNKLRVRLSVADEQKLAKNYTPSPEGYRLYLKGRYHAVKLARSEIQTGISYFQQAIAIDPTYALAHAGLAEGYRTLALSGEMPPTEFFPKAKAAAQKAIEIDDTLAEAHAEYGSIIFWYDWDWNAAESECKRALELDPKSADAHLSYAHLLSNTGRQAEGLAEMNRALELDPLNLRNLAIEVYFLIHAGRTDEALAKLQKAFELDPNFWFAHVFAASAYIEKGMFTEAVAAARKAREHQGVSSHSSAFLGYALAKSGKHSAARTVLQELLKSSQQQYISPYAVAMVYNGLGERDEVFGWLERGLEKRDPRMTFLKVEPKWNNLRADPRFQDLMRRVGFTP